MMTYVYGDGHVHIYPEYDLGRFFQRGVWVARELRSPLLLLLAEAEEHDYFRRLRRGSMRLQPSPYVIRETVEDVSLRIDTHGDESGASLFMIAGRQLVSSDGLEVLTIGLPPEHPLFRRDSRVLVTRDLVWSALDAGAITVLPWGFGKWLGRRGRWIRRIAKDPYLSRNPLLLFGDILARCWPWQRPTCFGNSMRALPGTDILPLRGYESRLARYGFRVLADFHFDAPYRSLVDAIRGGQAIESFGNRDNLFRAVSDQVRYRLRDKALP